MRIRFKSTYSYIRLFTHEIAWCGCCCCYCCAAFSYLLLVILVIPSNIITLSYSQQFYCLVRLYSERSRVTYCRRRLLAKFATTTTTTTRTPTHRQQFMLVSCSVFRNGWRQHRISPNNQFWFCFFFFVRFNSIFRRLGITWTTAEIVKNNYFLLFFWFIIINIH